MRTVRRGVFETNSSSTHSITLCSNEDYERWENGELYFSEDYNCEEQFVTKEEAVEILKGKSYNSDVNFEDEEEVSELISDSDFYTYDRYMSSDYLETFSRSFTTKSGDEVVAFGKYGYDG
jgi:hypothetical protein